MFLIHHFCLYGTSRRIRDMVGHNPSMLEILALLHAPNQIDPTTRVDLGHFEDNDFVCFITVVGELIPLNKGPGADLSKLSNVIHNS